MNRDKKEIITLGLIQSIQDEYGVDLIKGKTDRYLSDFRKMYCVYVYRNTRMTLGDISKALQKSIGNISYYISMHDKQMKGSVGYADNYEEFQDRMKNKSATI